MALLQGSIRSIEEPQGIPPEELVELRRIPGIGSKTVRVIQKALDQIKS